jgi:hypothetical protein
MNEGPLSSMKGRVGRLPLLAGGGDGRIARWVKGFRGFAVEFVVVLAGEVCWVERLLAGTGLLAFGLAPEAAG